jgi:malate dehydrogenase (oxaloacetate-decarboxylating)
MLPLVVAAFDFLEGGLDLSVAAAARPVHNRHQHDATDARAQDKVWSPCGEDQKFMDTRLLIRSNRPSGVAVVDPKRSNRKPAKIPSPEEVDENLKKANLPKEQSAKYHPYYQGKIEVVPRVPVRSFNDFAIWYTPGVAQPCLDIQADPEKVWSLTNKWNQVAVVTDGTRVLGLGDIGPEAGLPVMEGKALLFKYLGGVDAFPVPLATKDPEKIIETVKLITPAFGGVNLEDIAQPKCFGILNRLRKECEIAVWHDDQQGTATINVAGVINALKVVGKKIRDVQITLIGAGASNIRTAKLLIAAGAKAEHVILVDSKGIIGRHRKDVEAAAEDFGEKWELAQITNGEGRTGGIAEAMTGVDVVIAASKPGPGVIRKEWVGSMADDSILFVIANPVPEIWPWEAAEAGARVIATGRSDFPNQVNNSLGFPGIFRGTLDVRARTITDEMCIAAAEELARVAEERGLDETHIVPAMDELDVFAREAAAVGMKAIEQGIARVQKSRKELFEGALHLIRRAREETKFLMQDGFIRPPPP